MEKIKVSLLICPCWTDFCPPIGLAYLASILKSKGYGVKCHDLNIEARDFLKGNSINFWDFKNFHYWIDRGKFEKHILPSLREFLNKKVADILNDNAEIIGLSVFDTNLLTSLFVAERIKMKNPDKKIIFGGPECFKEKEFPKLLDGDAVDVVVIGEGEVTLVKLLEKYAESRSFENVKGSIVKINDETLDAGFREEIKNLDDLPYPDFSDFDIRQYLNNALPILTSRGCIARCAFCGETIYWRKFRYRKAESIFHEIEQAVFNYKVQQFFFNDSLVNGNLTELSKLADLIIESNMNIFWSGYARVDPKMDESFFMQLKKAGVQLLSYGIESGSQKVINDMNKNILLNDAERNLIDTINAGIEAHVNWIVGFPTESWLDFLKSLIFIFRNRRNISFFNPGQVACGILPRSNLALNYEKYNIAKEAFLDNWRTNDFTNTIIQRNFRLKILRKWIALLGIPTT